MSSNTDEPRPFGFINGLLTGVIVGAALAMWFAPPAVSDLRKRVIDSARSLGKRVGQQREQARTMAGETAEELAQRGQRVRDNIVDAVAVEPMRWRLTPQPRGTIVSPQPESVHRLGPRPPRPACP